MYKAYIENKREVYLLTKTSGQRVAESELLAGQHRQGPAAGPVRPLELREAGMGLCGRFVWVLMDSFLNSQFLS